MAFALIPSFVTDLSNEALQHNIDVQTIQFIIYFVDMKNERTWRVWKKAMAETPVSFTVGRSCVVVNDCRGWREE